MKLTVLERLLLLQALPAEGDLTNMRTLRLLRERLSFSEKEQQELEFQSLDGQTQWKVPKVEEVEIELSPVMMTQVVKALKSLDEQQKIKDEHLSLYDKFMKE